MYDTQGLRISVQAELALSNDNFLVLDPMELIPAMFSTGLARGDEYSPPTYVCQPNAYSVVLLQELVRDWYSAARGEAIYNGPLMSSSELKYASAVSASVSTTYPLTNIKCSLAQNLSRQADTAEFHFMQSMLLSTIDGWSDDNTTKPVNISGLRRDAMSHVRTQWVRLPAEDFGPVSIGLLFELPWSLPSDSRLGVACTVVASWVQGHIERATGSDYSAWYAQHDDIPYHREIRANLSGPDDPDASKYNRQVELSTEWLALLTPPAPDPPFTDDSWRPTTLDNIFYAAGFDTLLTEMRTLPRYISMNGSCSFSNLDPALTDVEMWIAKVCLESDKRSFIEWTVARLISDGLSRRLSIKPFEAHPALRAWFAGGIPRNEDYGGRLLRGSHDPNKSAAALYPWLTENPNLVVQRVDIKVQGLGYSASSTTDYLATLVAAVYLILSLTHVVWSLIYQVTSSSWDTATELVLLAYNSPPATALKGTSAQVYRWRTYKKIMKIRAVAADTQSNHNIDDTDPVRNELYLALLVEEEAEVALEGNDTPTRHSPLSSPVPQPAAANSSASTSSTDPITSISGPEISTQGPILRHRMVVEGKKYN